MKEVVQYVRNVVGENAANMKTLIINEPDKLYFTSDLHLDHANIIKYCDRPFKDKNHMNEVIINNWNSIINNDDTIFILGDFCLGQRGEWIHFINRLSGIKILIKGNHDRDKNVPDNLLDGYYDGFINLDIKDPDIKGGSQRVTLCHYPMLSWYQSHKGSWQLFGHWHSGRVIEINDRDGEIRDYVKEEYHYRPRPSQYDVGVDGNEFSPVSYSQIKKIINEQIKVQKR
jgi:calcineurin-like phosphoesterase family protein